MDKSVRAVYLVSRDRKVEPAYEQAIELAIKDLQGWYARQLRGRTFTLNERIVEVARSAQSAEWFYSHVTGTNPEQWGYDNALAEASRLVGARLHDPNFVWVIYSDGPGDGDAGATA